MGKPIPKKIITYIIIALGFIQILDFSGNLLAQNIQRRIETEISFPTDLNAPEIKFNLRSTGTKKFILLLEEKSIQMTNVKVFDILGNLILEDKISPEDGTQKSYDFSSVNSQLFVVEVGNAKYNMTKSVYANPQGQPTGNN